MTKNEVLTQEEEPASKKVFAKGICFFKLFWVFVIGCLIGTYYEQFLNLFLTGSWDSRAGVVWGPFNPVYGFGMVLIVAVLHNQRDWKRLLVYGAVLGGGLEYILSFLQDFFLDTSSWDYHGKFLNINGRTTVPFALFWGLLCILVVKFVYPFMSKWIEKIPYKFGTIISIIFAIFMGVDLLLTGAALLRQAVRKNGDAPLTFVGQWLDNTFDDEYLSKIFPNMIDRPSDDKKEETNGEGDISYQFIVSSDGKSDLNSIEYDTATAVFFT